MSAGAVRAGSAFVEIGADPRKFFQALGKVNSQIGKLGASVASAGTKMAGIGAGIVAPIFASAQAFASVGSTLNDMSKRTGVAAESLSVLQFAAEQTGTDMAGVETAVKKMQKAIFSAANGGKEASKALEMVGLTASDLAGLTADQQMGKIADGLMAIRDPGERAAIAMQIFGKAGTSILPMLEGGSNGMAQFAAEAKRLGLVMDTETAAKADSLGDAIDALTASTKMAFIQIGGAVAPALTSMAQGLAASAASVGQFIRDNGALVMVALQSGAALAAAGLGVIAIGKAMTFASSAIGGMLTAAKAAVAVFAAVASPVGLIVAGIAAMGGAALYFSGALGGIADLAKQTFGGIYDAIANNDLSGAMDILWAGLHAGWLRGVETLMGYVDPWISTFQNTFTYAGTEIAVVWEKMWTGLSATANTIGAYLMGAFDNIINGVLKAWDTLESGILKSWNYIQSFFRKGFDLKAENERVDSEMAARARDRELAGSGIEGRAKTAAARNEAAAGESASRIDAMRAGADATARGRLDSNARMAGERRAATLEAESALNALLSGRSEKLIDSGTSTDLAKKAEQGAGAAGVGGPSQAEVAGTFSSVALGGMGFGSSLMQKVVDYGKRTAEATEEMARNGAEVAA